MTTRRFPARLAAAIAALAATTLAPLPATAGTPTDSPPDYTSEFMAGYACRDFGLRIDVWEGKSRSKDVRDGHGRLRTIGVSRGGAFRYTNMVTGKQAMSYPQGSVQLTTTYEADGSQKVAFLGSLLLIWFPTDIPAGPSTVFYDPGHVVYTLSPEGVGTLLRSQGRTTDVCAELS